MRAFKLKKCKRVHGVHFTPEGGQLLVVGGDEVRLAEFAVWLDLGTGEATGRLDFLAECYAVSANHRAFAVGREAYGRVDLADLVRWRPVGPEGPGFPWHRLPVGGKWTTGTSAVLVGALAFTPDGAGLIASVGRQVQRNAGVYDWTHYLVGCRLDPPGVTASPAVDDVFGVLAVRADRRLAATGGIDGNPEVCLFDDPADGPAARFKPAGTRTYALAFAPDGSRLAAASGRVVHLLTADDLTPAGLLDGHKGQVNAVAFAPDGRHLLTASHDGAVRLWEAGAGKPLRAFEWKVGPVTAVAVAPDGLTAVAAGAKGQLVVWDLDA